MPSAEAKAASPSRSAGRDRRRRAHRAEHRRRMEARRVDHLRRDEAQPARQLAADRDPGEQVRARQPVPLGGGQHGGHDHRAGMHRPALERVVIVLAMGGGAVDRAWRRRARTCRHGRSRCSPRRIEPGEHGSHVVRVAGREAQPADIEHEPARRLREPPPADRRPRTAQAARASCSAMAGAVVIRLPFRGPAPSAVP